MNRHACPLDGRRVRVSKPFGKERYLSVLLLLPFRKKSSSSWGTLPSACSILMVMLKEKRSLCLSNSPVERQRQGLHFRTAALAQGTLKSEGSEMKPHITRWPSSYLMATAVHVRQTSVCTWHDRMIYSVGGGCASRAGATFSTGSRAEFLGETWRFWGWKQWLCLCFKTHMTRLRGSSCSAD